MYNENERSHFFRDLIVKILLVLLFVFLIMWLVPMPNLNPLYDKVFTQNMNTMTDAAKGYFTTSRLPKEEGETKKLTLGDMINNKMLIEFTDSNGKKCDKTKSYVEVTKKGGEYVFKTNLSCSNQEDYVIEYYGCYDICSDGKCDTKEDTNTSTDNITTKKVTEYQFSKKTTSQYIDKYICSNGYTLKGDKCMKATEIQKQEDPSLKCLTGYSYNSNTNKCEKLNTVEEDATLVCPQGYIYATSLDKCIKGTEDVVDATLSYKCSEGTLIGTKCVITNTNVTDATKEYKCSEGTLNGTKCIIKTTKEEDAQKEYTCSEGTLNGTKCVVKNTNKIAAKVNYSCSQGTLDGTECVIVNKGACGYTTWACSSKTYATDPSTASTPTFTRRFITKVGNNRLYEECTRVYKCAGDSVTRKPADKSYSCSSGTRDGAYCIITTTKEVNATLTYKCANGVKKDNKCIITTTKEVNAELSYKCTKGALTDNNKCIDVVTAEKPATKVYNCPVGKLNGTKCEISGVQTTDKIYACNYGTLRGNKCLIATTETRNPIYYCKEGYTLADKKCYIMESSTDLINATPIYKTKTETVYKWSTKETLEGWTRTGKTRTKEVAVVSKWF